MLLNCILYTMQIAGRWEINCKDQGMVILKFHYLVISSRQVVSTNYYFRGKHYRPLAEPRRVTVSVWEHGGKAFPNIKTNYIQDLYILLLFK